MSNHYHVVLHVDKARAEAWAREEVVERWLQLYKGSVLVERWQQDQKAMDKASLEVVYALIEVWRERWYDISWFMHGVNGTIARTWLTMKKTAKAGSGKGAIKAKRF